MLDADAGDMARMLSDNCPEITGVARVRAPRIPADEVTFSGGAPYGVVASLIDLMNYLPDDVLTKVDRASMAVSLESRAPLLDHRVAEFATRLPWSMRGGRGNEKRALRHLLYRHVPRPLVDRPKMGFSVPIARWLRNELRPWAEDLLASELLGSDPFIAPAALRAQWVEHVEGRADRSALLWSALMYLAWRAAS